MTDKKGSERLDTRSTDAYHWAECFCEEFDIQIAGDLHPWFANYWAAVHDPLARRVDELEQAIKRIEEAQEAIDHCGGYIRERQYAAALRNEAIVDAAKMVGDI